MRAPDDRVRRSDMFSFDHKRQESKDKNDQLEAPPAANKGVNVHGTANTSHSILRNFGPI